MKVPFNDHRYIYFCSKWKLHMRIPIYLHFLLQFFFYFRFICSLTSHIFQAHNGRRGRKKKKINSQRSIRLKVIVTKWLHVSSSELFFFLLLMRSLPRELMLCIYRFVSNIYSIEINNFFHLCHIDRLMRFQLWQ